MATMASDWIKYKDFYLHLPTKRIITNDEQVKYCNHFPDIGLEDINKTPDTLISILKNSGYIDKNDNLTVSGKKLINTLYNSVILKRTEEDLIPIIYGQVGGKTTLCHIIRGVTNVPHIIHPEGEYGYSFLEDEENDSCQIIIDCNILDWLNDLKKRLPTDHFYFSKLQPTDFRISETIDYNSSLFPLWAIKQLENYKK